MDLSYLCHRDRIVGLAEFPYNIQFQQPVRIQPVHQGLGDSVDVWGGMNVENAAALAGHMEKDGRLNTAMLTCRGDITTSNVDCNVSTQ